MSFLYVTVMYKEPYRDNYPRMVPNLDKAGPGDDAATILGKFTTGLPMLTPLVVNQTVKGSYGTLHDVWGTHSEVFSTAVAQGKVQSTAIGIPFEYTNRVLDIAFEANSDKSFVGVFSVRFVKQTKATLGFTKYPYTCVAEFDSFEAPSTWRFYERLWNALEQQGIPYTFHWGKVNNLDPAMLKRMYGSRIDEWIAARNQLLPAEMLKIFTNQFMTDLKLDTVIAPIA